MENHQVPELSRPLAVERLGKQDIETRILASDAERAALATRFGLLALDRFEASVSAHRAGPGARARLTGHVTAEVVQACVVSLEPVRSVVSEGFSQLYDLDPSATPAKEVAVAPGIEDDEPEPVGPNGLDLGEAVAQQLALMLDPYPRVPGASLPPAQDPLGAEDGGKRRPFEALRALKPR